MTTRELPLVIPRLYGILHVKYCCNLSLEKYVKVAVTNLEEDLDRNGKILPSKCVIPLSRNYSPWREDFPELMADGVQKYQELIDQIRWAVEIGRLDILLETLLFSSYLEIP